MLTGAASIGMFSALANTFLAKSCQIYGWGCFRLSRRAMPDTVRAPCIAAISLTTCPLN